MTIIKTRHNNSIDIFRYIASVLIVALHTDVFSEINPMLSYVCSQVIPRIGVPFFFAVSGYYYTKKLQSDTNCCRPYVVRLLKVYTMWSVIYFFISFIKGNHLSLSNLFLSFVVFGSEWHFWYFPALIFCVLFVTFIFKVKIPKMLIPLGIVLYVIGLLGNSYYFFGSKIMPLNTIFLSGRWMWITEVFSLGLPFFICGYLLNKTERYFKKKNTFIFFVISSFSFLAEVFILKKMDWAKTIMITVSLVFVIYFGTLLLLQFSLPNFARLAKKCKVLSSYTYYSHIMFLYLFSYINESFFNNKLTQTMCFLFIILCSALSGLLLSFSKNKLISTLIN